MSPALIGFADFSLFDLEGDEGAVERFFTVGVPWSSNEKSSLSILIAKCNAKCQTMKNERGNAGHSSEGRQHTLPASVSFAFAKTSLKNADNDWFNKIQQRNQFECMHDARACDKETARQEKKK